MGESLRLGRIAGVPIGINWSVLVIATLIAWSLAAVVLPEAHPDAPTWLMWLIGFAASVLFFGSLLAHEIAHTIVALRAGVEVEGITLWLFGGMAKLKSEAETSRDELRIAIVGPLTSLAISAAFFLIAVVLSLSVFGGIDVIELLATALAWLALMNLFLAVFNMIPAAPLDGGRVLRSIVWRRTGDPLHATVVASRAGRAFGYVLAGLGILQLLAGFGLGGLWLVFLGWFLVAAATAEAQRATQKQTMGDIRVREVMTPHPTVAPAELSVAELIDQYVFGHRWSSFPLIEASGQLVGLVTMARVKKVAPAARATTPVLTVASPMGDLVTAGPDERLAEVIDRMAASPDGRALVLEGGTLVGILAPFDVMRALERESLRVPA